MVNYYRIFNLNTVILIYFYKLLEDEIHICQYPYYGNYDY